MKKERGKKLKGKTLLKIFLFLQKKEKEQNETKTELNNDRTDK